MLLTGIGDENENGSEGGRGEDPCAKSLMDCTGVGVAKRSGPEASGTVWGVSGNNKGDPRAAGKRMDSTGVGLGLEARVSVWDF
jgi:hypothetical protein